MSLTEDVPKPKKLTGGCLCDSLKYEVTFPEGHDFDKHSGTCQCNQCRKGTSSLFYIYVGASYANFSWTTGTGSLKFYFCVPENERAFCSSCGSWIFWHTKGSATMSIALGTVDSLYLWGEGADGVSVPRGGFGRVLAGGNKKTHEFCENEIPGVTDEESISNILGHLNGSRFQTTVDA
ncbi:uncharacterized protein MKZ38_000805 [Zalerion maritima]|uniref:CENP-V/GFA domain-containing protein n=1 Tax=Zalerion maritima TaxID=339359 RepID=A0AAD5RSN1_9PEZI|nr:uncharacterized protein MKZ38_000805 [Zalerion maritima]